MVSYQLSVISYQLSVISYQLSVISYQLSVISDQWSEKRRRFPGWKSPPLRLREILDVGEFRAASR
jgi:hypothetical protein